MAGHRITCAIHVTIYEPHQHTHVAIVGTGEPESRKWTLPQIFAALDAGDSFCTSVADDGPPVPTERHICEHCAYETIRSAPGAPQECDLASIVRCR